MKELVCIFILCEAKFLTMFVYAYLICDRIIKPEYEGRICGLSLFCIPGLLNDSHLQLTALGGDRFNQWIKLAKSHQTLLVSQSKQINDFDHVLTSLTDHSHVSVKALHLISFCPPHIPVYSLSLVCHLGFMGPNI